MLPQGVGYLQANPPAYVPDWSAGTMIIFVWRLAEGSLPSADFSSNRDNSCSLEHNQRIL
jgi:hypothetical protein